MTLSIILAVLALGVPIFLIWLAKGHVLPLQAVKQPAEHIRPVDLEAFRNLIDPQEEEYLRANLPPADFRKIQRARLRAAVQYISCVKDNAAILLRIAETARRSPDAATAETAARLVDSAVRLRMYAFLAIPRLYLGMILPGLRIMPVRVADSYEQMTRQVLRLGLQSPASRASASL
ncbi:MAG: hypothetical protein LAO09_08750 [Acidobacteriia bacterium]|nr:hypothetical protein [Terriglobia bacterium]